MLPVSRVAIALALMGAGAVMAFVNEPRRDSVRQGPVTPLNTVPPPTSQPGVELEVHWPAEETELPERVKDRLRRAHAELQETGQVVMRAQLRSRHEQVVSFFPPEHLRDQRRVAAIHRFSVELTGRETRVQMVPLQRLGETREWPDGVLIIALAVNCPAPGPRADQGLLEYLREQAECRRRLSAAETVREVMK